MYKAICPLFLNGSLKVNYILGEFNTICSVVFQYVFFPELPTIWITKRLLIHSLQVIEQFASSISGRTTQYWITQWIQTLKLTGVLPTLLSIFLKSNNNNIY